MRLRWAAVLGPPPAKFALQGRLAPFLSLPSVRLSELWCHLEGLVPARRQAVIGWVVVSIARLMAKVSEGLQGEGRDIIHLQGLYGP